MSVTLRLTELSLAVCKINDPRDADLAEGFFTLSATGRETSLVCETSSVPQNALQCEAGYRAFEILGPLDLSMIGVVAGISTALAKNRISVFIISTFDTDYILVKEAKVEKAIDALVGAGYSVVQ